MINIFKSQATQYVYIQGVTHSFAEYFEYVRNGNLFTINTKFSDVPQVCEIDFTQFVGKDLALNDIIFTNANDLEAYLILTFTQDPLGSSSSIYGSNLNVFRNDNILINGSVITQSIINSNTTILPIGTYEIEISYSWNHNSTQSDFQSFFLFDGIAIGINPTGVIHREEPKDSAGNFMSTGSLQHLSFYKKFIVTVTTIGIKNINLAFNTDTDGCLSSIFETLIKLKRIA